MQVIKAEPDQVLSPSGLLLLGIFIMPLVFSWFTLQPGYSNGLRTGAFAYLALTVAVAVVRLANAQ